MIRKVFKKKRPNQKIDTLIEKYKIPRAYLSINRKSIANALAIGLFIAMIPMPMQMLAVILMVPFLKFNVPLGISLVWITNPITMPIIYYVEYLTGNFLLMRDHVNNVELTVEWFSDNMDCIFIPLYTGAFFYALLFAGIAYFLATHLWIQSVHQENHHRRKKRK